MTKKEFTELTGEDPEDMFGGDWGNTIDSFAEPQTDYSELIPEYIQTLKHTQEGKNETQRH